jgi:hypothetical protein
MADLPVFLTKNSAAITISRNSGGTRNDIGELEDLSIADVETVGVIEAFVEPGYTGQYNQDNQGKDTRQRFRLYVGPSESLQTGDFVTSGDVRYEVGVVSSFESHIEAIMFKMALGELE